MFLLVIIVAALLGLMWTLKQSATVSSVDDQIETLEGKLQTAITACDTQTEHRLGVQIQNLHNLEGPRKLMAGAAPWRIATCILGVTVVMSILGTSIVDVSKGTTGHFDRKWFGANLQPGELVARTKMDIISGTKGPQSETVLPGTHFMLFQNVLYSRADASMEKKLVVPAGHFAVLVAKDGAPMTGGRMLAPAWDDAQFNNMLTDANYFLNNNGMKGMQYTVVPSGEYHINNYVWSVLPFVAETKVGTGQVAVIRSNIQLDDAQDCTPLDNTTKVPLVPQGCRGVWATPLEQGTYRFNPRAVSPTIISVRQNTNDHTGNYTRQLISFTTDKEGNIQPTLKPEVVKQNGSIDDAIDIRAEGWNIDQDVSTFWQIEDAPRAVAELGNQDKIAQFVARVTQSEFRIVAQGKDSGLCVKGTNLKSKALAADTKAFDTCYAEARQAMDLVYKRGEIESQSRDAIADEVKRYGVAINKVTMGRPNIPTELLMPTLRTQYAQKMRVTLTEEEQTAIKRIKVQNANELANNQAILVTADLEDQAATKKAQQIVKLANARKTAAFAEAEGQKKLLNVMGADKVQEQILTQKVLDAAVANPDIVKVPEVNVVTGGGGGSLEGAFAVLGHSNVKAALTNNKANK